jgi:hypothetical protein
MLNSKMSADEKSRTHHTSKERLYLDADGNVVKADDPNRLTLLVGAGGVIPMETALKHGLLKDEKGAKEEASKARAPEPPKKADAGK